MATIGMDPSAVRALADELDRIANQLHALIGATNGNVGRMHAGWLGADAEQLVNGWQRQSRPALETLAGHVHTMARTARTQAQQQDVASGVSGGGIAGGGVAGLGELVRRWAAANGDRPLSLPQLTPALLAGLPGAALAFVRDGKNWDSTGHVRAETVRSTSGSTTIGGVPMSGDASVRAYAEADYKAHAGINRNGAEASAAAGVGVGVAAAANGRIGNDFASASGHVGASAEARAEAKGDASIGRDGVKGHAEAKAFVGAHADASVRGEVAGVGSQAAVTGYAGAGVEAKADAQITAHEVKASVHVGAALGLGVGFTVSVDVQPAKVLDNIKHIHLW